MGLLAVNKISLVGAEVRHLTSFFLLLFLTLCFAGTPSRAEEEYRLAPGDRLQVIVFGEAELSGDFSIDSAGSIHYPLVGRLDATGKSLAELEKVIADHLSTGVLRSPSVFVRLIEARPIHVLGYVRSPGTYPYHIGGIIRTAIAQAGGFGSPNAALADTVSEFLAADQQVKDLAAERAGLGVMISRIQAQLDGQSDFVPQMVLDSDHTSSMAALIEAEKRLFLEQEQMLRDETQLIRSRRPVLLSELNAIEQQIRREQESAGLIQERIDELNILAERGLARSTQTLDMQLALSNNRSNIWRLEAEKSRLNARVTELDIQLTDFTNTYRRQLLDELTNARQRMLNIDAVLPSIESIRNTKRLALTPQGEESNSYIIRVTRILDGDVTIFDSKGSDKLQPGDIIEVLRDAGVVTEGSGLMPPRTSSTVESVSTRNDAITELERLSSSGQPDRE